MHSASDRITGAGILCMCLHPRKQTSFWLLCTMLSGVISQNLAFGKNNVQIEQTSRCRSVVTTSSFFPCTSSVLYAAMIPRFHSSSSESPTSSHKTENLPSIWNNSKFWTVSSCVILASARLTVFRCCFTLLLLTNKPRGFFHFGDLDNWIVNL